MKRASDDVPDDWSPLLRSVNHVDRILDERPLRARSGLIHRLGRWYREIRQSPDRQHIDGGHTVALKAEGRGAG